ncbi:uncharacterized protein ATC70_007186 [Mucor velutinosus]|uniref:Uncharacterized protein n=1 Tax=Mucor velutinosus TaxID=708070 RepID=A0AAN7D3A2_9FUNG|nr:hypothetical protein ATC70_007186 [Mucor velutinosus]
MLDAIARDTPQPASELMMVARGLYKTNLENMWASNKIFNKSLNKLLEILLRAHLAPKRESHYWELQQTKAKKQPKQVVKSDICSQPYHSAWSYLYIDWDTMRELQTRTNQALRKDIDQLETDTKAVSDELKAANKDHKKEQYSTRIKDLKNQRHTDRSKRQGIKELKAQRHPSCIKLRASSF